MVFFDMHTQTSMKSIEVKDLLLRSCSVRGWNPTHSTLPPLSFKAISMPRSWFANGRKSMCEMLDSSRYFKFGKVSSPSASNKKSYNLIRCTNRRKQVGTQAHCTMHQHFSKIANYHRWRTVCQETCTLICANHFATETCL